MDLPQKQRGGVSRSIPLAGSGGPLARDYWTRVRQGSATFGPVRTPWRRTMLRMLWMGCSLLVLLYSVAVLTHVAWMGTIGVRCMFGTKVEEEIPADYDWRDRAASHRRLAAYDRGVATSARRKLRGLHPGAA